MLSVHKTICQRVFLIIFALILSANYLQLQLSENKMLSEIISHNNSHCRYFQHSSPMHLQTEYICFKVTAKSISNYRPFILGLHSHHVLTFTLAHLQPAINCCNLRWNRFRKLRVLRTFCYEDLLLHFRSCCVGLSADDMESLPLLEFKKEKIIFCI